MKLFSKGSDYFKDLPAECQSLDLCLVELGSPGPTQSSDKVIFVGDNVDLDRVINVLHDVNSIAVVQRNERLGEDLFYANRLLTQAEGLFKNPSLLQLPNLEFAEHISFLSHQDKRQVIEKVEQVVVRSGVSNVSDTMRSITEELFMNAIFDAPREAIKKGWGVEYARGQSCSFDIGYDSENFCISCSDPFGSLDVDYLLQRLKTVFEKGAGNSINFGNGGAGLGCYILLENCVQMTIAVRAKQLTFFSCLVPRFSSRKDRVLTSKALHVVRYL